MGDRNRRNRNKREGCRERRMEKKSYSEGKEVAREGRTPVAVPLYRNGSKPLQNPPTLPVWSHVSGTQGRVILEGAGWADQAVNGHRSESPGGNTLIRKGC